MDDLALRIGLIAGSLAVAFVAAWLLRRRASGPVRAVSPATLDPGVHFFSSTACGSCRRARGKLTRALGGDGFVEHVWEQDPGVFDQVGVDAVPSTVIILRDGSATLYPGNVARALAAL